jgi:hypothetical protein
MPNDFVSASSDHPSDADAAAHLAAQLEVADPSAILAFFGPERDGRALVRGLRERFPGAEVIGCTAAGQFTDKVYDVGGAAAMAISRRSVPRAFAALAPFEKDVDEGVRMAAADIARRLGARLDECEPTTYVGLVLLEGLHGREEAANEALGRVAPFMSIVGGSAADNYQFRETQVHCNASSSTDGAVLLVLETATPFVPIKTCSFRPRTAAFRVTRADPARRVVYELDGKPIVDVYGAVLDLPRERIDRHAFSHHPLGLMIDGSPWVRTGQATLPDGGVQFACQLVEGMQVHFMDPTDIIADTRRTFADAEKALGTPAAGAVLFNCVGRRIELEQRKLTGPFHELLRFPALGFHTYGESWIGHMNHTLTGVVFA